LGFQRNIDCRIVWIVFYKKCIFREYLYGFCGGLVEKSFDVIYLGLVIFCFVYFVLSNSGTFEMFGFFGFIEKEEQHNA
jgi:hypothetical protein